MVLSKSERDISLLEVYVALCIFKSKCPMNIQVNFSDVAICFESMRQQEDN